MSRPNPTYAFAALTIGRGALVALSVGLAGGLLSALYSVPFFATYMEAVGLDMRALRPLHTTFGAAWMFLAPVAVVYRYLAEKTPPTATVGRLHLRAIVILWALAGAGALISLPLGFTSGREYVGFHPILSIPILVGWILFSTDYLRRTWRGFWEQPAYVVMWGVGCLLFIYTFLEQHAWLLPWVFEDPLVDKRIQWKACGTLVGAWNVMVYGCLLYVGERLSGDREYAQSRVAWALMALGLLNTHITNISSTNTQILVPSEDSTKILFNS